MVCIGLPYCWQHSEIKLRLRIADSTIPNAGKGLFAHDPSAAKGKPVFRKGDIIVSYTGEKVSRKDFNRRYPGDITAAYALAHRNGTGIDSACKRGIASLANAGTQKTANSQYALLDGKYYVECTRDIRHGQEILVDYGSDYRFHDTIHTTRYSVKPVTAADEAAAAATRRAYVQRAQTRKSREILHEMNIATINACK